jgi:hypothetical protein
MNSRNGSYLHVILIAALLALAPLAIYGGAYVGLTCGTSRRTDRGGTCRVFRSQWQAMMFLPACLAESVLTGHEVLPAWRDPSVGPRLTGS